MASSTPGVADVFRRYGEAYRDQHGSSLSTTQLHAISAIELCRTAALGGHVEHCDSCEHQRIAYNSCRNRNCPKCQSLARAGWLADRQAKLLDTQYFHVVFTAPDEVAVIAFQNKPVVYDILFHTLFHLPNSSGSARHVMLCTVNKWTASRNLRSSCPGSPRLDCAASNTSSTIDQSRSIIPVSMSGTTGTWQPLG